MAKCALYPAVGTGIIFFPGWLQVVKIHKHDGVDTSNTTVKFVGDTMAPDLIIKNDVMAFVDNVESQCQVTA